MRARLPLIVVILSHGNLATMSGLRRAAGGDADCTDLNKFDAAFYASAVGAAHRRVGSETELKEAIDWASKHAAVHGPVLLDVATSYAFSSYYARGIVDHSPQV